MPGLRSFVLAAAPRALLVVALLIVAHTIQRNNPGSYGNPAGTFNTGSGNRSQPTPSASSQPRAAGTAVDVSSGAGAVPAPTQDVIVLDTVPATTMTANSGDQNGIATDQSPSASPSLGAVISPNSASHFATHTHSTPDKVPKRGEPTPTDSLVDPLVFALPTSSAASSNSGAASGAKIADPSVSPSPTASHSAEEKFALPTMSASPSMSTSATPMRTMEPSATPNLRAGLILTFDPTPSPSASVIMSPSSSVSASLMPGVSASPTVSLSSSPSMLASSSPSATVSAAPSISMSASPTATTSISPSVFASASASASLSPSPSMQSSATPSGSASASASPSNAPLFPTPSEKPDACDGLGTKETEFKDAHFSHAVAGGPYVETDFKKTGYAYAELSGLGSHSHFTKSTEIGSIVKYKWSWIDPTHRQADKNGLVTVVASTLKMKFPVGVTPLKLQVWDQFCNTAVDTTTVTVNPATKEGAYCYYYDFESDVPTVMPLTKYPLDKPRPKHSLNVGDINFGSTASFGNFPFNKNTFAVRCIFSIEVQKEATIRYRVVHSGPVSVYSDMKLVGSSMSLAADQITLTDAKTFGAGLHSWQILYMNPKATPGKLIFQFSNGGIIPASTVRHDAGATMPVISKLSRTSGIEDEFVWVIGSAFVNGAEAYFGLEEAEIVESTPNAMLVRVPRGIGTISVSVKTDAGVSNGFSFTYELPISICPVVKFHEDTIKTSTGSSLLIRDIAVLTYGPDMRLYLGSQRSEVFAMAMDRHLRVTKMCRKNVAGKGPRRWVLGMAFNPKSTALKLFFTTSTFYWKKYRLIRRPDGWANGKVQSITLDGPTSCFNDDVTDVVTGLPVTNHDHGVNFVTFTSGGKMLIGVGGFTNGGISIPTDGLGGFQSNPLSGAVVECPEEGTNMIYSGNENLANVTIVSGACKPYATGLRNSFGGLYHSNGNLYVTDNGPNRGFGEFATDCKGGQKSSQNLKDKLHLVVPGKCHGHPNHNRALRGASDECAFEDDNCVKPLLSNLQSPTTGIMEYRSNCFGGKAKGDIFLTKFSDVKGKNGRISRVQLSESGQIKTNGVQFNFFANSGLSAVEGPRGEIIMSRVYKASFMVLTPVCRKTTKTYFMSVHPKQGPSVGNHRVLISGYNFGSTPTVKFGSKHCNDIRVIDDDSFTCLTPPGLPDQQVKVYVNGTTGENMPTQGTDYWYF